MKEKNNGKMASKVLAERLKGLMEKSGNNEESFAELCNMPKERLHELITLTGEEATVVDLLNICKYLPISADYLVGRSDKMSAVPKEKLEEYIEALEKILAEREKKEEKEE